MKKLIYLYLCLLAFILGSCQFSDDDYQKYIGNGFRVCEKVYAY